VADIDWGWSTLASRLFFLGPPSCPDLNRSPELILEKYPLSLSESLWGVRDVEINQNDYLISALQYGGLVSRPRRQHPPYAEPPK
jgi:hypothetical protein